MSDVSRVEEIFMVALEQSEPDQRAKYLDAACAGDVDLRRRVEELLVAQPKLGRFLEPDQRNAPDNAQAPTMPLDSTAAVGDRVGPYKLLERIGEGGMGEVWVADQQEPIKRRVALKLIKPGMDSRSVLARFEAERQALAVMDHPNIAKVLDAGTTKDGRPYFVMELVKGTPITEFADARQLTPKQRLEMFVPVCQAIQHAHMKGIIHRDIKPSNVLVALHDEIPIPKVIDFGVAKAVGPQLTDKTIYTGFGALIGTPAYMAPEQATFNQLDIDTRADVYSLGVLLYELLAGSPPIEAERMKKAAIDEVLRIVRDEEPPRPSQRLSTSQMSASIAATRQSDPAKLSQLMKGEIDWIVMKALEKDRTRRYDTANSLAVDVQRYLCGEQVQAVPPSLGYRLAKAYRRNRAAVLVSIAFTLMMLTGVTVATVLAIQARRAEKLAETKRIEAEEQTAKAEENRNAWEEANGAYMQLAIDAEIRSNSARIDADLLEYKSDSRVGLLRLARPLKDSVGPLPLIVPGARGTTTQTFPGEPDFVKLREFQAAAVIAAGQEFVPLVPPLAPLEEAYPDPSADGRWFLSHTDRGGLVLWSMPSQQRVGLLRETQERVLRFGFTPDSKTIWTQDVDSVVRFWNTDGTFRAKTPLRPERFEYPGGMTNEQARETSYWGNNVLVADGVAIIGSRLPVGGKPGEKSYNWNDFKNQPSGPTDLYSTRTGQFIRRLDRLGWEIFDPYFSLVANDRWLYYQDHRVDKATGRRDIELVIVSADDGRELARLDHPGPEPFLAVNVSPTGKWVVSYRHHESHQVPREVPPNFLLWRSQDWKPVKDAALTDAIAAVPMFTSMSFISDDLLSVWGDTQGVIRIGKPGSWTPSKVFGQAPGAELDGTLLRSGWALFSADPIQRLNPPRGRKHHPDLAKIAPDGRFLEDAVSEEILDTVTEKGLTIKYKSELRGFGYFPGLGRVDLTYGCQFRILPDPRRLNIPPPMLELWAQVVTGGELGVDGRFEEWDEPTWQAKQKELAAMELPFKDFPFPGWVATEPHLWWRIQADMRRDDESNKLSNKLLDEWRRRSGRIRLETQPDTWRTLGPVQPTEESQPSTSGGSSVSDAPNTQP